MRSAWIAVVMASGLLGCRDIDGEVITLDLSDLPSAAMVDDMWQTSGIQDSWIEFPEQTSLVVTHELGRVPTLVLVYVSFDEGGHDSILAAGDMGRIAEATAERVVIRNATKENFFVRIVLR